MMRDELAGWLLGMNRFNAGARAFWLEAYGGRPYSLDRIKSAGRIYVPRLAVAWHGGVQPSRLTKLLTDGDDGLLARFLWFWPESVPFRRRKTAPNLEFATSAFGASPSWRWDRQHRRGQKTGLSAWTKLRTHPRQSQCR